MRVAIGMRIPQRMQEQDINTVATWASGVGLGALDLPADFAEGARACGALGLRIGTVDARHVPQMLSPDEGIREGAVNAVLEQISAMGAVGAGALLVCLVPEDLTQPIARSLEIFAATFPRITEACEAAGVRIALEGWPGPPPFYPTLGYTPEVWRAIFAAVPSPALGLCYDPSHLVRLGIDYLRVLEEFKSRIVHCHGKDTAILPEALYRYGYRPPALDTPPDFSEGAWRYSVPGDGAVNWAAVAYVLEQAGYEGVVSIELEDARYWGTREREQQGILRAYRHLAQQFV
jgi:sugar phosphate isomerase/epimerase